MARTVSKAWQAHALNFLFVAGPGIIVTIADNDAGAVSTYTNAGATYGTHMLWLLVILLPMTYFVQEMVIRLGIATGRGHAAMIYERFGKWWGRFSLIDLLTVNFLTLVTEFAMTRLALSALGVPPWFAVPTCALVLVLMVAQTTYLTWERITLLLCAFDICWLAVAIATGAHLQAASFEPGLPTGGLSSEYIFLVIATIGTTIAPWQLFFQQSCIADKRLRFIDIPHERIDTLIGACMMITMAACMMLIGNLLYTHHIPFLDAAQMAGVVGMLVGSPLIHTVLLLMLVNASVLGAITISLASSWAFGEVVGWRTGLDLKWSEAKGFYGVFTLCVLAAAAIVLIPNLPLQLIILSVQVLCGIMLPSTTMFLQLLLNDKQLLGEYANPLWNNIINWSMIAAMLVLSLILAAQIVLSL